MRWFTRKRLKTVAKDPKECNFELLNNLTATLIQSVTYFATLLKHSSAQGEVLPGILLHNKCCLAHRKFDKISSIDLNCFTILILDRKLPCTHIQICKTKILKLLVSLVWQCVASRPTAHLPVWILWEVGQGSTSEGSRLLQISYRDMGKMCLKPDSVLGCYLPGCMHAPHLSTATPQKRSSNSAVRRWTWCSWMSYKAMLAWHWRCVWHNTAFRITSQGNVEGWQFQKVHDLQVSPYFSADLQ